MKAVTLSAMLLSLWTCVWGRELLWVGGKNSDMCDAANWIDQATGLAPSGRAATSEADHDTLVFENAKPGALTKGGTLRVDGLMMRGSELDVSSANDYANSIYFNVVGALSAMRPCVDLSIWMAEYISRREVNRRSMSRMRGSRMPFLVARTTK